MYNPIYPGVFHPYLFYFQCLRVIFNFSTIIPSFRDVSRTMNIINKTRPTICFSLTFDFWWSSCQTHVVFFCLIAIDVVSILSCLNWSFDQMFYWIRRVKKIRKCALGKSENSFKLSWFYSAIRENLNELLSRSCKSAWVSFFSFLHPISSHAAEKKLST